MNNINLLSLEIKNFKSISYLNLDMKTNKNGIDKDINLGRFKMSDSNKFAIPSYISIFGRNSMGKTTIIDAIRLIADASNGFFGDVIRRETINEAMVNLNMPHQSISGPFQDGRNFQNDFMALQREIFSEIDKREGKHFDAYNKKILNFFTTIHSKLSFDNNADIELKMELEINGEKFFLLTVINKNGLLTNKIQTIGTNQPYKNTKKYVIDYLRNIHFLENAYPINNFFQVEKDNSGIKNTNNLFIQLTNLYKNIGEKRLLKLIKLADNKVTKISFVRDNNGKITFDRIFINHQPKLANVLSSGTRQFITLADIILSANKKRNGMVLIDEIENSLHKELVDVLKLMMVESFIENNIQFIFTSHSPLSVHSHTTFKQIYSLEEEDGEHRVEKLSAKFKDTQSIVSRYIKGDLANYPDVDKARNTVAEIMS